ncbi:MAG TPA: dihydropteroate synthase [Clostridiales bacterium]|nr:dihydropteroate synthase [Clostridiales bacterium]
MRRFLGIEAKLATLLVAPVVRAQTDDDIALLVGVSRKRFIGAMMEEVDPTQRLEGTLAANFRAVELGADIVRVHDIAEHKRFFKAADFLLRKG